MTSRSGFGMLWMMVAGVSLGGIGLAAASAHRARSAAEYELDAADDLAAKARQVAALRTTMPSWGDVHRPDGPLAPSLSAAITSCGLATSTLSSVNAESPVPASGETDLRMVKRQRAMATLSNLTLPQLGKFLAAWREREPAWIITAADLAPESGSAANAAAATGGDLPIRATLTLEMLFVDRVTDGGSR